MEGRENQMSEKKILVPEGMLKSAVDGQWKESGSPSSARNIPQVAKQVEDCVKAGLEAALLWLSENPIVPSKEWMDEQIMSAHHTLTTSTFTTRCIAEWQRIMFISLKPRVPEEIEDLLEPVNDYQPTPSADYRILEAFRRGQKSGGK